MPALIFDLSHPRYHRSRHLLRQPCCRQDRHSVSWHHRHRPLRHPQSPRHPPRSRFPLHWLPRPHPRSRPRPRSLGAVHPRYRRQEARTKARRGSRIGVETGHAMRGGSLVMLSSVSSLEPATSSVAIRPPNSSDRFLVSRNSAPSSRRCGSLMCLGALP